MEQLQHQFFIFLPLTQQLAIGGRVTHIAKDHQRLSCTQLIADTNLNALHRSGVGSCVPGTVNIQFAGADSRAVLSCYLNSISNCIRIILYCNGHFPRKILSDLSGCRSSIREGQCDSCTHRQRGFCFKVYRHQSIQAQDCQGAVLQHHALGRIPLLRIEHLDNTACQSRYSFLAVSIAGQFYLFRQIFQGFLHLSNGRHNRNTVYRCDGSAFCYCLAVCHKKFLQLHGRGNRNRNRSIFCKCTAADQLCVNAAHAHSTGQNTGLGAILLRVLSGDQRHSCQHADNRHNAHKGNDAFYSLFLCFIHFLCFVHILTSVVQGIDGLHLGCLIRRIKTEYHTDDKAEHHSDQHHSAIQQEGHIQAGNNS